MKTASGYDSGEWCTKADYRADCLTCGMCWAKQNAMGVAAQHARKHKHCVRVEASRVVIFNHEGS